MSEQVEIPNINDLPDITENSEFSPAVKLLTTETPVLGYDGADINPANWQAQALANRTQWLRDKLLSLSTRLVLSVNGKTGNVVVTYTDIGADAAGTADALMTAHLTALDPHSQYLDETRGDARYVQRTLANQSNGWLQLDAAGKIPAAMLQTLASRYVVVANQAARLALSSSANLTICAQVDIDTLFYLNGGDNPAVAANWVQGQSATVSWVSSVYGRTGAVVAQNGDYDADKITETATRKFATPAEKTAWNAKQTALESGSNIRSLFGNSLLGSGNLAPTPAQMGAAAVHTHTTADISDFTQQAQLLIIGSLVAGSGITLGQNPITGKMIISSGGGSGSGTGYIVVDRPGATVGQDHVFSFSPQSAFNLTAYALKEDAGATNQTYVVDDFATSSEQGYNVTNAVIFDGVLRTFNGGIYELSSNGDFYSSEIKADGSKINISVITESIVPAMTSNSTPLGYVASASNYAVSDNSYAPWVAFDGKNNAGTSRPDCWSTDGAWLPSVGNPYWLRIDLPSAVAIDHYQIVNRGQHELGNPRSWTFQGSDDGGTTWINLHSVSNDTNNTASAVRHFEIGQVVAYRSYRLLITAKNGSQPWLTVGELNLFSPIGKFVINHGGKNYSILNGALTEITGALTAEKIESSGVSATGNVGTTAPAWTPPVTLISNKRLRCNTRYTPSHQIAIQQHLTSAVSWAKINSATLTTTQTNNGALRVAVTRDLVNWLVWRSGQWVDLGALTADTAGATKLISDGMTPAELGGITAAQWTLLFASNNSVPDYLAFSFALEITDPATDVATIDRLALNVNEVSSWKLQTPAEVEILWRTNSVTFRTVAAGNYKLAYQIP